MSKNILVAVSLVLVVIIAGWYFLQGQKSYNTTTPSPVQESASSSSAEVKKNTVTITNNGFSPQNITIKVGESVNWINIDSESHTVNSSAHPAHSDYLPLNIGVIVSGESKSLVFPDKGVFKYHDHLNSSLAGMVIVE